MAAKKQSRIMSEMHELAGDLYSARLITKTRMKEFDALCGASVHEFTPQQIKGLREQYNLSQTVFASILNLSPSTVRKWEIGEKHPGGPSLKLLNILESKGLEAVL